MAGIDNLKPFKPGYDERRGSKPKGAIHLSTRIQRLLNDERFLPENVEMYVETPMDAIIATAMTRAREGDSKWATWLTNSGYRQKLEVEHSGEVQTRTLTQEELDARIQEYLRRHTTN